MRDQEGGPRQKGSFLAKIQCGGRERDAFLASGRGQGYQSARLPAQVTTTRRSYHPSRIYFHPTRPAATLGGFSFGTSILNTLNVEYRKVEALIPYARNPRTHA